MTDKVTTTGNIAEYNRAQFEGAYRSLIQMVHALAYIDIEEVRRWIMKITKEDSEANGSPLTAEQIAGRDRVMQMFSNMDTFKASLKETGVPPMPPINVQEGGRKQ